MSGQGGARWSLRGRLSRNLLVLVTLGWVLAIAVTAVLVSREMNEMMDQELRALADETQLLLDSAEGAQLPRSISISGEGDERVVRIIPQGFRPPPAPWGEVAGEGYHDSNGWRILRVTAENSTIEVGHNQAWRKEEIAEASLGLLVLILPLGLLTLYAVRRSVGLSLDPARDLAETVLRRGPDDSSALPLGGLPDELLPLAEALNEYTARIGRLRAAERDFVANAAHELRTPIAALRARLEVESPAASEAVRPILDRLTRRIERLLQLSRIEAGVGLGQGPSDLLQILRLILEELPAGAGGQIRLDDGDVERMMLSVDPDALAILLRNIIDNARENGMGQVRIAVLPRGVLRVDNPVAPGASFREARFDSGPASRGAGLGLAIIDAMSKAMDVPLSKNIAEGRARVEVDFSSLMTEEQVPGRS